VTSTIAPIAPGIVITANIITATATIPIIATNIIAIIAASTVDTLPSIAIIVVSMISMLLPTTIATLLPTMITAPLPIVATSIIAPSIVSTGVITASVISAGVVAASYFTTSYFTTSYFITSIITSYFATSITSVIAASIITRSAINTANCTPLHFACVSKWSFPPFSFLLMWFISLSFWRQVSLVLCSSILPNEGVGYIVMRTSTSTSTSSTIKATTVLVHTCCMHGLVRHTFAQWLHWLWPHNEPRKFWCVCKKPTNNALCGFLFDDIRLNITVIIWVTNPFLVLLCCFVRMIHL
jgi:hypothetical protein